MKIIQKFIQHFKDICVDLKKDRKYRREMKGLSAKWAKEVGPLRQRSARARSYKSFVANNGDWDGGYLIELIIYKIERMIIAFRYYGTIVEGWEDVIAEMEEVVSLGNKIRDDWKYTEGSYAYFKEHSDSIIHIEKRVPGFKQGELLATVKGDFGETEEADQWCKQHGYKEFRDVVYGYTSEWHQDGVDHQTIYRQMVKDEVAQLKKDTHKFFHLIEKNYGKWWY